MSPLAVLGFYLTATVVLACAGLASLYATTAAMRCARATAQLEEARAQLGTAYVQMGTVVDRFRDTETSLTSCQATMSDATTALLTALTALENTRAALSSTTDRDATVEQIATAALERATGQRFDPTLPNLADLEGLLHGEGTEPPPAPA